MFPPGEKRWVGEADDKFTFDFWNFVGKGKCRMENGHKDDGKVKGSQTSRLCSLLQEHWSEEISSCCLLSNVSTALPVKELGVTTHQAGEKGPSMADMGISRGLSREAFLEDHLEREKGPWRKLILIHKVFYVFS